MRRPATAPAAGPLGFRCRTAPGLATARIPALPMDVTDSFEALHPRGRGGKFTVRPGAEQEGALSADPGGESLPGAPECTDPRCSRINGACAGLHCPACGEPCGSMGHQGCGAPPQPASAGRGHAGEPPGRAVAMRAGNEQAWAARAAEGKPRPVTGLTATESGTLEKLPLSRLAAVARRLKAGPAEGYREAGPELRQEIARRIGRWNLLAISGGRVIPMADGIELPVSSGYSVRVRLAVNGTCTVQRVFTRAGTERVKGERTGVHPGQAGTAAYYASCFQSHDEREWTREG